MDIKFDAKVRFLRAVESASSMGRVDIGPGDILPAKRDMRDMGWHVGCPNGAVLHFSDHTGHCERFEKPAPEKLIFAWYQEDGWVEVTKYDPAGAAKKLVTRKHWEAIKRKYLTGGYTVRQNGLLLNLNGSIA